MLKFTVDGQKLELLGDPFVVADSFDFLTGSFKFYSGHDWDLTEKHVFFQLGEATPYEVTLTDDEFVKADHVNLTTGTWSIYVIGYDIDGATLVERITTNKVSLTVDASGVPEGEPFPPSIIPDVLIVKDQTVPQTFVGGIPKLAADRVIDLDNEIVDKKHVADQDALKLSLDQTVPQTLTAPPLLAADRVIDSDNEVVDKKFVDDAVAAVTADDFAHNSLSTLQGGSAAERYHMTQAENAALHAHSNKTALDAVSGTNTGDQDVSGAISTHNTDAGAHSILARKTETMRLLISRTIGAGENVSAITWTKDDAGNALALIEEEIKIYIPSNTIGVGVNGDVYLRLNDKAGASDYHIGGTRASSVMRCAIYKTLYGKAYTRIGLFGGFPMAIHGYAADDGTTLSQSVLTQGGNFQVSSINKIYVYIGTLTYFPAGTVIEIYGRTA